MNIIMFNAGLDTFVISDATATFNKKGMEGQNYPAQLIHETALASLNDEFARRSIAHKSLIEKFELPPAGSICSIPR